MHKALRTALLISGSGSTAETVIKAAKSGKLQGIDPVLVVSSRPNAPGLAKARKLGVQTFIVERKNFATNEEFGRKLLEILHENTVQLVSQNGWITLTPPNVVAQYRGRIINQHPAPLDPGRSDFGGTGMFGRRVMCSRLAYLLLAGKEPWTEATVHLVTEEYDKGNLVKVTRMDIENLGPKTSIEALRRNPGPLIEKTEETQTKLLPIEHRNVIEALRMFTQAKSVPGYTRDKPLIPPENADILKEAKELAMELFPQG